MYKGARRLVFKVVLSAMVDTGCARSVLEDLRINTCGCKIGEDLKTILETVMTLDPSKTPIIPAEKTDAASADVAVQRHQDIKDGIADCWKLYNGGKFNDCAAKLSSLRVDFKDFLTQDHSRELHAIEGWYHYQLASYEKALESISASLEHPRAVECELYIRCYVPEYRDEVRKNDLVQTIGDNIQTANAIVVNARTSNPVPYSLVEEIFKRYETHGVDHPNDVRFAHLLHNTGRVFLDKARNDDDLRLALKYFSLAADQYRYGETNLHHRAALGFYTSETHEKLGDLTSAFFASLGSLKTWRRQIEAEPGIRTHVIKFLKVFDRTMELSRLTGIDITKAYLE